jgi:DNA-binding YbaB/EbfC family protein
VKGLGDIMKQAQAMQAKLAKVQEELASRSVEASSGGGMVTVTCDGQGNVLTIKIDPEVVNPQEVAMLEELVAAAVNEARKRAQEMAAEEMGKVTQGMLPPGIL